MEFTGERLIPELSKDLIYAEHMARYIFASQLVKGKVVLDVACGTGYGAHMFSNKGARKVFAVDISQEAIDHARRMYGKENIEFITGDAEKIPLPDRSIDIVVSFETIEHLRNYRSFLSEIKRLLKKNGLAIISTPNKQKYPPGNQFHIKEFSGPELEDEFKKYFKNLLIFYQDNWISSYIFEPTFAFQENIKQSSGVDLSAPFEYKDNGLYIIAICSDGNLPTARIKRNLVLSSEDVLSMLGEIEEKRRLALEKEQREKKIKDLNQELISRRQELSAVKSERDHLKERLDRIYSFKIIRALRFFYRMAKVVGRTLRVYKEE